MFENFCTDERDQKATSTTGNDVLNKRFSIESLRCEYLYRLAAVVSDFSPLCSVSRVFVQFALILN